MKESADGAVITLNCVPPDGEPAAARSAGLPGSNGSPSSFALWMKNWRHPGYSSRCSASPSRRQRRVRTSRQTPPAVLQRSNRRPTERDIRSIRIIATKMALGWRCLYPLDRLICLAAGSGELASVIRPAPNREVRLSVRRRHHPESSLSGEWPFCGYFLAVPELSSAGPQATEVASTVVPPRPSSCRRSGGNTNHFPIRFP